MQYSLLPRYRDTSHDASTVDQRGAEALRPGRNDEESTQEGCICEHGDDDIRVEKEPTTHRD
jgi:hypothetical protein